MNNHDGDHEADDDAIEIKKKVSFEDKSWMRIQELNTIV